MSQLDDAIKAIKERKEPVNITSLARQMKTSKTRLRRIIKELAREAKKDLETLMEEKGIVKWGKVYPTMSELKAYIDVLNKEGKIVNLTNLARQMKTSKTRLRRIIKELAEGEKKDLEILMKELGITKGQRARGKRTEKQETPWPLKFVRGKRTEKQEETEDEQIDEILQGNFNEAKELANSGTADELAKSIPKLTEVVDDARDMGNNKLMQEASNLLEKTRTRIRSIVIDQLKQGKILPPEIAKSPLEIAIILAKSLGDEDILRQAREALTENKRKLGEIERARQQRLAIEMQSEGKSASKR